MRVRVKGRARVYPTESVDKVKRAVENLFPTAAFSLSEGEQFKVLQFEAEGTEALARIRLLVRQERIRDAVRKALERGVEGNVVRFFLNKQVAYVARFSLCEPEGESPLGPIEVELHSDDPKDVIGWLTAKVEDRAVYTA